MFIILLLLIALWYYAHPVAAPVAAYTTTTVAAAPAAVATYPQYQVASYQHTIPPPPPAAYYYNVPPAATMATVSSPLGTAVYQSNAVRGVQGVKGQPSCGQIVRGGQVTGEDCVICGCDVSGAFENCCPSQISIQTGQGINKASGCVQTGC